MRELIAQLLGKDLTKWNRLKIATGVVSDEDLLSKLIHFYAEAKGISLAGPQLPPTLAPLGGSRSASTRFQSVKEETAPSSFIVIHQDEPPANRVTFLDTHYMDEAANPPDSCISRPMLMLREGEDGEEEMDGEENYNTAEDLFGQQEYQDIPIGKAEGIYYRERVRPTLNPKCIFSQDEICRALDGVLWRQAVLTGRPMPLEGIRLIWSCCRLHPIQPTVVPWLDPPPIREYPSETVLLKEFGCALCGQSGFSSRVELITHFWLRHPETRERSPTQYLATKRDADFAHCSLCFIAGSVASSTKYNKLVPHVSRAHVACQRASETAPHVCDVCHVELSSEAERDDHVAAAHPDHEVRRFTCCVCSQVERGEQAYIRHLRLHYTEFAYSCNICPNFRSRRPETMAAHTASHERRTFRCGRCQFVTRTFRTLVDHIRIHLQLPRHVCPVCGYKAYTSSRYFNHMDTHGGRLHRCEICSEEFTSMLKKSQHKIVVHRRPAKFTCDRCDITFKTSSRLRRHQASHTGLKPFTCELCGKGLSSKQSLKNHARICSENDELYGHGALVELVTARVPDGKT